MGSGQFDGGAQAFRWTADDGMVGLGDLPGGHFSSHATDASADGAIVVGYGSNAVDLEAFRWTSDGGIVGLGDLAAGAAISRAHSVSADGEVVVGYGTSGNGNEAFYWTQSTGMQRLLDVLVAQGATGLTGWKLTDARSISGDGTVIVGYGLDPLGQTQAFMAVIPPPPSLALFGSALGVMGWMRRGSVRV